MLDDEKADFKNHYEATVNFSSTIGSELPSSFLGGLQVQQNQTIIKQIFQQAIEQNPATTVKRKKFDVPVNTDTIVVCSQMNEFDDCTQALAMVFTTHKFYSTQIFFNIQTDVETIRQIVFTWLRTIHASEKATLEVSVNEKLKSNFGDDTVRIKIVD